MLLNVVKQEHRSANSLKAACIFFILLVLLFASIGATFATDDELDQLSRFSHKKLDESQVFTIHSFPSTQWPATVSKRGNDIYCVS